MTEICEFTSLPRMEAELKAAEADAARFRFLADNYVAPHQMDGSIIAINFGYRAGDCSDIRAAIDEAMGPSHD